MARIRTVKPEFFQHEALQDLEAAHPDLKPMLVFAGLWGHCDKNGVFEWKPRTLKLGILPFLPFKMEDTLALLETSGQLSSFEREGKKYGHIPTFSDHQRIGGKEHSEPARHPAAPGKQHGSNREPTGEAPGKHSGLQEGKGREGKGETADAFLPTTTSSRGTRIPDDFTLTSERRAVAEDEGLNPERTFAKFTDYWRAASGAKATKVDWDATWRNWCRNDSDRNPKHKPVGGDRGLERLHFPPR